MLAIGIEDNYEIGLSLQPMAQSSFNRLPFATVLRKNDDFGAGFACEIRRFIPRAVIDNQNVVKFLACSSADVADVLLLVVSGNDRRGCRCCHPYRTTG